jgi:hypothetical protein
VEAAQQVVRLAGDGHGSSLSGPERPQ